jgi:ABC-type glutathione transport system ATPase component
MLLEIKNVHKSFGSLHALKGVSFFVRKGESLGIVGESGSGKSTLIKITLGLLAPDHGNILFEGEPLSFYDKLRWKRFRKKTQVVFQNPFSSLNPRMRVREILEEPLRLNGENSGKSLRAKIESLLKDVDLPEHFAQRLPRELSGGECQRIAIARALSTGPELLVCDEPVSSLDLLAQARILNLFLKLQKERGVGLLFVSHDLNVVHHLCDSVLRLKEGEVCEKA